MRFKFISVYIVQLCDLVYLIQFYQPAYDILLNPINKGVIKYIEENYSI